MPASFYCLPPEIHEKILSFLTNKSLLNASKVCKLWFFIAGRLAKNRGEKIILEESVHEARHEIRCCDEDLWLQLLYYHYLQLLIPENLYTVDGPILTTKIETINRNFCYTSSGSYFYITYLHGIEVYNAQNNFKPIIFLDCGDGPVKKLVVVNRFKKIIILSNILEVYDLPVLIDKNYEMKRVKTKLQNFSNELNNSKGISVDGSLLAVQTDDQTISIFKMDYENNEDYLLKYCNSCQTQRKIYEFSLWKDEVVILLVTGEILWWPINSSKYSQCGMYTEVRYQNPVWIKHGRIFCSTLTSRVLLGLWHMEVGTWYWLIGKPTAQLSRYYDLDPIIDGAVEVICSLNVKYRLLVCGTTKGKLIIYYLSDSFYHNEDMTEKKELNSEFNRKPEAVIKICDFPIDDLLVELWKNSLYVMIRFSSDTLAFKLAFYRITLNREKWVEDEKERSQFGKLCNPDFVI